MAVSLFIFFVKHVAKALPNFYMLKTAHVFKHIFLELLFV